ncbi:nesprin-4 isoform X3 [Ailuropoda melanoleuca]|uniref:nesprin-4 isoform X3 n=1 Tax=Ailuropoda melanoleuca TaxID=9646 RepID=UPI001494302F|nr:nesprin-4 isoform X3 [Ailuropoda melanoleuca]
MALPPPLGLRLPSEPLSHPPEAPRELGIAGCTICPASGGERIRLDQAQKLGQDSMDPPQHFQGGLRGTAPAAGPLRLPTPSTNEDPDVGKHCEALQADLRAAAERVDALLVFGEGLAQRSEPQARASLEQILRALRAHRSSIFRRLWWLQAQLVSYSMVWPTLAVPAPGTNSTPPMTLSSDQVFEEANPLDQDLEVEGDLDGPGPGGVWGPWAPSSHPTPAELEWDPAGDVGGLRPLVQKTTWTPGAPCELCGHRGPQGRGQYLEDMLMSGFSHRKHLAGHRRRSLLRQSQDKNQASSNFQDVMLEVDPGAPAPASGHSLTFLLLLFLLFLLLVGATLLLPPSGGSCCSPARLSATPYLVLSYVNGPPPI